jgi:hypothetical protein
MEDPFYIDGGNNDVEENRAGILYNGVKNFTGSNPFIPTYSSPLGSNEGSVEIDSDIHIFIL